MNSQRHLLLIAEGSVVAFRLALFTNGSYFISLKGDMNGNNYNKK